jgi:hypothetical protein
MCTVIDNLASCEICTVISSAHAKNISAAEIYCELRMAVYGRNAMTEGTLRQCCRIFKDGQTNAYDEE